MSNNKKTGEKSKPPRGGIIRRIGLKTGSTIAWLTCQTIDTNWLRLLITLKLINQLKIMFTMIAKMSRDKIGSIKYWDET